MVFAPSSLILANNIWPVNRALVAQSYIESLMKVNMHARLLKYKEKSFTLSGQYKRHAPLIIMRFVVMFAVFFSDSFLPVALPDAIKFFFIGVTLGAQVQEFIWIYKHQQTWNNLIDSTEWNKIKSRCN